MSERRLAVSVKGVVQGVGFRPFVYQQARERDLSGWVLNGTDGVRIEVQGPGADLDAFLDSLRRRPPGSSLVETVEVHEIDRRPGSGFRIRRSQGGPEPRPALPADLATCPDCIAEVQDAAARRYRYPFTNCTNCGPRFTIVEDLPYDRPRTSMRAFAMCSDCAAEYEDPEDRRFHAQPIACPACGPRLELLASDGRRVSGGDDALREAASALGRGRIVALQALGGFQLLVDATDADAVARLRRRKQRPDKPFALLLPSVDAVRDWCHVSSAEEETLRSTAAPIVLLLRHDVTTPTGQRRIADGVAPGNSRLGVLLPSTPLHRILAEEASRPLVCTSGNLADEPLCVEIGEALERLHGVADVFLGHDRPIVRPVDDSVVQLIGDEIQVIRRARRYAPAPLPWGVPGPTTLALGGHLKSTIALRLDDRIVPSQHLGDLSTVEGVTHFERTVRDLLRFYRASPERVVCDLHPDYLSTRIAERLAAERGIPLVRVQHHHAHVESCRVEHGVEGELAGLSWDGTGYGADGTIWGGEVLVSELSRFRRVAHLRSFPLPGGERAVHEPRRSALGLLVEAFGGARLDAVVEWFTPAETRVLLSMLESGVASPRTTSVGRLFDAIAALCGIRGLTTFEGQAAMELQYVLERAGAERLIERAGAYPLPLTGDDPAVADWEPLVQAVLDDRRRGTSPEKMSARFHNSLAEHAVEAARRAAVPRVVLTGGCFQNAVLVSGVRQRLLHEGFDVFCHGRVPANDGGLSVGQIAAATGAAGVEPTV